MKKRESCHDKLSWEEVVMWWEERMRRSVVEGFREGRTGGTVDETRIELIRWFGIREKRIFKINFLLLSSFFFHLKNGTRGIFFLRSSYKSSRDNNQKVVLILCPESFSPPFHLFNSQVLTWLQSIQSPSHFFSHHGMSFLTHKKRKEKEKHLPDVEIFRRFPFLLSHESTWWWTWDTSHNKRDVEGIREKVEHCWS